MPGGALGQDPAEPRRRIDSSKAHPARVHDVFLGGKDHHPADRDAAAAGLAANPRGYLDVRHNRDFLRRAVTTLVEEHGIRQFLDIGTGLPTAQNVHQIAQRTAPGTRVVYVDNDPVVLAHARALLTSGSEGRTDYVDADLQGHRRRHGRRHQRVRGSCRQRLTARRSHGCPDRGKSPVDGTYLLRVRA